ncbi:MAG: ATP-binding protein [Dehalococcoidia bacterium]|nr:MAG: ATP-binding protein [Dehalococcoidia bacterium]
MCSIPAWLKEVVQKWEAGIAHVFILYGNVDDLVEPGKYVKDILLSTGLIAKRSIVISYNRSKGITFPIPAHKDKFLEMLNMKQAASGALAALQQARGQAAQDDVQLPAAPGQALPLIERTLAAADESGPVTALIVENAETICPNTDIAVMSPDDRNILVTVTRWAREKEFISAGPPVFLLVENISELHMNLRRASSRIEAVKVPYPDREERLEFIKKLAAARGWQVDEERLAAKTAGLKRVHIEDIFLRADLSDVPVNDELVKERKNEIIRSEFADVLEIIEPTVGFNDIGGMDYIKQYFLKNIIQPMKENRTAYVPMGALLLGPAGTGKTVLAKAVAKESGMNCCSFNVGKLLGSYVGTSEKNLERTLECIQAMAPTIVIMDELDQSGLSRSGSGDSGVSNRILQRLLEFMSDDSRRGKIVFMGISNRSDLIDAALKRPGRFDKKIPVLAPDNVERESILKVLLKKYNPENWVKDINTVVEATEGWTGAELEALVLKACEVAEGQTLADGHMAAALDRYFPTTQDIERMTALAVAECNDADLLPPRYRTVLKERSKAADADSDVDYTRKRRAV